jgi:hypothetical protein
MADTILDLILAFAALVTLYQLAVKHQLFGLS